MPDFMVEAVSFFVQLRNPCWGDVSISVRTIPSAGSTFCHEDHRHKDHVIKIMTVVCILLHSNRERLLLVDTHVTEAIGGDSIVSIGKISARSSSLPAKRRP